MTVQSDRRIMEKAARVGALYDFYAPLLTDRQRQWMDLHYLEDLSLGEIAEQFGVTRQAVHDNLRRAEEQLESYDAVLHLIDAHARRTRIIATLRAECETVADVLPTQQMEKIQRLLEELSADG